MRSEPKIKRTMSGPDMSASSTNFVSIFRNVIIERNLFFTLSRSIPISTNPQTHQANHIHILPSSSGGSSASSLAPYPGLSAINDGSVDDVVSLFC